MPLAYQNTVEKILLGNEFPLYVNIGTVFYQNGEENKNVYKDKNTKESPQFTHGIIKNESQTSEYWSVLRPILYQLIATANMELEVVRCKINVNYPHNQFADNEYYSPHVDTDDESQYVGIYYVNDCDGDTLFFEKPSQNVIDGEFKIIKRVTPKKGNFVFFKANTVHAGTPPKKSDLRCVINFNFKVVGNKNA